MNADNRGLRFKGRAVAEYVSVSFPKIGEGEALLKVLYAGVCGSDYKVYLGKMNNAEYPVFGGHEFSAEIVAVPQNERGLKAGQIVTAVPFFQCGSCYSCRKGFENCCENNKCMGVRIDGCFRKYISMPISKIVSGQDVEAKKLALVEPLACAHHLIKRVGIEKGQTVLFFGAGPIGTFAMMDAKRLGANVTVADYAVERLEYSKKLGADNVVNLNEEAIDKAVRRIAGEDGFGVTIESAGHPQAFLDAINSVSYRGRVGLIGVTLESVTLHQAYLSWKEISIIASRNEERSDFEEVISYLQRGDFANISGAISGEYSFDDSAQVFERLESSFSKEEKVIFRF